MSFPHSENARCIVVDSLLYLLIHCQGLQNAVYIMLQKKIETTNWTYLLRREEYDILFTEFKW